MQSDFVMKENTRFLNSIKNEKLSIHNYMHIFYAVTNFKKHQRYLETV